MADGLSFPRGTGGKTRKGEQGRGEGLEWILKATGKGAAWGRGKGFVPGLWDHWNPKWARWGSQAPRRRNSGG